MQTKSAVTRSKLPDVDAEEAQHSRHLAKPPQTSVGRLPKFLTTLKGLLIFTHLMCPFIEKQLGQKYEKDKVRRKEGIQRESTLTRKEKNIDSVQSKSKKYGGVIYPTDEH